MLKICFKNALIAVVVALSAWSAVAAPAAALEPAAKALFANHKASVVQVRLIPNSANEHSALGSGFVVQHAAPGAKTQAASMSRSESLQNPSRRRSVEVRAFKKYSNR